MEERQIIALEERDDLREKLLSYLRGCSWSAGRFLAKLHKENSFFLEGDRTYFLMEGDRVVSFLTLAHQDCIADKRMTPWIGFVYTDEEYRGMRSSEKLIRHALKTAKEGGVTRVYLASDHIGLYEGYGFEYMGSRRDIYGEECRIYVYFTDEDDSL